MVASCDVFTCNKLRPIVMQELCPCQGVQWYGMT